MASERTTSPPRSLRAPSILYPTLKLGDRLDGIEVKVRRALKDRCCNASHGKHESPVYCLKETRGRVGDESDDMWV